MEERGTQPGGTGGMGCSSSPSAQSGINETLRELCLDS